MNAPQVTYMPLDQLVASAAFRVLSPRHAQWARLYLQGFIQTGIFDHAAATKIVYPSSCAGRVRAQSCWLRHNPKVLAVVKLFLDSAEKNIAADLAEIQRAIEAADPGGIAMQRLIILKARLKYGLRSGLKKPVETENPKPQAEVRVDVSPRNQIGSVVPYDGGWLRVTVVDVNGQPTDGDPCLEDGTPLPE
jgi:hypothetical protein